MHRVLFLILLLQLIPFFAVLAEPIGLPPDPDDFTGNSQEPTGLLPYLAGTVPGTPLDDTVDTPIIENPLKTDSIIDFLVAILGVVMALSVPVIIFFTFYAGFLYVTARGNSEQVGNATRAFTYAVIGGLIVLGAMALIGIIQNFAGAVGADVDDVGEL